MATTRERTRALEAEFRGLQEPDQDPNDDNDIKFRWIHLPANNMQWMQDMAWKVYLEQKLDPQLLDWFVGSWEEALGKGPPTHNLQPTQNTKPTHYMKPQCASRTTEESRGEDVHRHQVAIYMPYLTPSRHSESRIRSSTDYADLLRHYEDNDTVIHGTRTLDEFYYHFCDAEDIEKSINDRNKDQVLSKAIHKDLVNRDSWILISLDQIWIWVLDAETILTSATHRRDSEYDPVLTATLGALRKALSANNGRPRSAFQMSELILTVCVGLLDRQFDIELNPEPDFTGYAASNTSLCSENSRYFGSNYSRVQDSNSSLSLRGRAWRGSIKEVFTNAIAQVAIQESDLYANFISREQSKHAKTLQGGDKVSAPREIIKAANLFREIKDIRDELKILKIAAEHQTAVQKDYCKLSFLPAQGMALSDIVQVLNEMDRAAERIETAVNTTLTLEQNAAAIAQADAAVQQGRIILLFTVVTIAFLPLSFFTSLFAVQVEDFLKTPPWAFGVMFGSSFSISALLAVYAFYSDTINRYASARFSAFHEKLGAWKPKKTSVPSRNTTNSYYSYMIGTSPTGPGSNEESVRASPC